MQVIYPVPVYTGIIVLNPPEHPDYSRRNPNSPQGIEGDIVAEHTGIHAAEHSRGRDFAAGKENYAAAAGGKSRRFVEARGPLRPCRPQLHHDNGADSASHRPCAAARKPATASGKHPFEPVARPARARTHSREPRDTEAPETGGEAGEQARSQACAEGGEQSRGEGGFQAGHRPTKEAVTARPTYGLPTAQPALPRCAWQD